MNKYLLIGLFLLVFLFGGFFLIYQPHKNTTNQNIRSVKIAGQEVRVDLALTDEEHRQGLSGRDAFGENEGMLFVFNDEGIYSFWMKDMKFPIDIIWIDKNLKVVYVKENALPESYPESFSPSVNAKYVLEVAAGFSEKNNLKKGDSVEFLY